MEGQPRHRTKLCLSSNPVNVTFVFLFGIDKLDTRHSALADLHITSILYFCVRIINPYSIFPPVNTITLTSTFGLTK